MASWILYCATAPSGKRYFGVTSKTVSKRRKSHRDAMNKGSSLPFHKAMRKYGDAIEWRAVVVGSKEYILDLEERAIQAFKSRDRRFGYNVAMGGAASPMLTPEVAAKRGRTMTGRPHPSSQSEIDALRRSHADPDWRARRAADMRKLNADPIFKAAQIERTRQMGLRNRKLTTC